MSKELAKGNKPAHNYSLPEVEAGLLALAMAGGSPLRAANALRADEEAGFKVSPRTLTRWRERALWSARDADRSLASKLGKAGRVGRRCAR